MHYDAEYIKYMMNDIIGLPKDTQKLDMNSSKVQETDFNLLQSNRTVFDWASKQTYIALGNMMTSAAQIGIDSCPIEGFDKEKVDSYFVKKALYKAIILKYQLWLPLVTVKKIQNVIKQDRLWIQLLNGLSNIAHTNNAPNSCILILKKNELFSYV